MPSRNRLLCFLTLLSALAVPVSYAAPSVVSLTPNVAAGLNQTYVFVFADSSGYQALGVVNVLINRFLDGREACYLAYSQSLNVLYLVNDAGSALLPGLVLNGTGSVSNSHCTVSGAGASAAGLNNTLTLTLNISFNQSAFSGNKVVYLAAGDSSGANSGWQTMGVLSVPPATPQYPMPQSVSPAGVSTLNTTLSLVYQDATNYRNLSAVEMLINSEIDGRQACYVVFHPSGSGTGTLYLIDDAGDAGGPYEYLVFPATGTVSNSQCAISGAGSSVSGSGAQLTLTLNLSLPNGFTGAKGIWLGAQTASGANSDWQALGSLGAQTTYILDSNLTDPLALRTQNVDGSATSYYGVKDSNGLTTGIYASTVADSTGKTTTWNFDSSGRPTQITGSDGTVFRLAWQGNNSQVQITAVSPDGSIALPVSYTLPAQSTGMLRPRTSASTGAACSASGPGLVTVHLTDDCPSPLPVNDAAEVDVVWNSSLRGLLGTEKIPACFIGGGVYAAQVPIPDPTAANNIREQGNAVQESIETECKTIEALKMVGPGADEAVCTAVAAAAEVFSDGAAIPAFEAIVAVCSALFEASDYICQAGNVSNLVANVIDTANSQPITLQAFGTAHGVTLAGPEGGPTGPLPPGGPFSGINIGGFPSTAVTGINLSRTALAITVGGAPIQLTVKATGCSGTISVPVGGLQWSSVNQSVAMVDVNGNVTGLSDGTTTVTATEPKSGKSASALVVVQAAALSGTASGAGTLTCDDGSQSSWIGSGTLSLTISSFVPSSGAISGAWSLSGNASSDCGGGASLPVSQSGSLTGTIGSGGAVVANFQGSGCSFTGTGSTTQISGSAPASCVAPGIDGTLNFSVQATGGSDNFKQQIQRRR